MSLINDLGEVDSKVIQFLASSSDTSFSFQGLKRSLKVHQEKLARSLNRLYSMGLIEKNGDGYLITKKGMRMMGADIGQCQKIVIGQLYLPRGVTPDSAAGILRGRWFGCARWLGSSMTREGVDLKWVTEDGEVQLLVSIKGNVLEVSVSSFPPGEEDRAREVALRLYEKIINALHKKRRHFASS
ncbi:MAG: hypothetical protein N3D12_01440 [Candidatus Methanomethyliaceae archaeon]|nr:hypothetical protein [Candidatus Methanomethyliaceae archaeon]